MTSYCCWCRRKKTKHNQQGAVNVQKWPLLLLLLTYLKALKEMIKLLWRKVPRQLGQQLVNVLHDRFMFASLHYTAKLSVATTSTCNYLLWLVVYYSYLLVLFAHYALVAFSAFTLLVGRQEGHLACKRMGDSGGGHWLVRMEWCPARWSVCLPLLIFPCTTSSPRWS